MSGFAVLCLTVAGLSLGAYAVVLAHSLKIRNGMSWWAWRALLLSEAVRGAGQAATVLAIPGLFRHPSWTIMVTAVAMLVGAAALWLISRRMSH